MIPEDIYKIYPEYDRIHGPYNSGRDKRARVILSSSVNKNKTTRLFAKIVLECFIGRRLVDDETVDHIDKNPLNDSV